MEKNVVLVVDGISAKTKQFSRDYITQDATVIFSDQDPDILEKYLG